MPMRLHDGPACSLLEIRPPLPPNDLQPSTSANIGTIEALPHCIPDTTVDFIAVGLPGTLCFPAVREAFGRETCPSEYLPMALARAGTKGFLERVERVDSVGRLKVLILFTASFTEALNSIKSPMSPLYPISLTPPPERTRRTRASGWRPRGKAG
jgi:hypothetical protein